MRGSLLGANIVFGAPRFLIELLVSLKKRRKKHRLFAYINVILFNFFIQRGTQIYLGA